MASQHANRRLLLRRVPIGNARSGNRSAHDGPRAATTVAAPRPTRTRPARHHLQRQQNRRTRLLARHCGRGLIWGGGAAAVILGGYYLSPIVVRAFNTVFDGRRIRQRPRHDGCRARPRSGHEGTGRG